MGKVKLIPVWEKCECCDDFLCNLHGDHVGDCECPPIEDWAELDLYPYDDILVVVE